MQTQQLHVESISTVANDVYKIILTCSEPLQYQAGQYCMIVMGEGDCRPFSIASHRLLLRCSLKREILSMPHPPASPILFSNDVPIE